MPAHKPLSKIALLLLSFFGVALLGCGEAQSEAEVAIELWLEPDPPSAGSTQLELELSTPEGASIEGADVRVEATMSHAGMVPEFVTCTEGEPGRYSGSFELTMGGDWILIVDVTLSDGRTAQRVLEVPGVAPRRSE